MEDDEKPGLVPTGPKTGQSGEAGPDTSSDESPDVDTPAWEGPDPEEDDGPKLVDPRPEIPGPAGF